MNFYIKANNKGRWMRSKGRDGRSTERIHVFRDIHNPSMARAEATQSPIAMAKRVREPNNPTKSRKAIRSDLSVQFKIRTVKVANISRKAWEDEIAKFLSFPGEIQLLDGRSDDKRFLHGYVTFKDSIGAAISVLLSGATICDQSVTIDLAPDYPVPPFLVKAKPIKMYTEAESEAEARAVTRARKRTLARQRDELVKSVGADPSAVRSAQNAEGIVSLMLALGLTLGEDAISKAKAFDEKYQLTSTASATKQD